MKNIGVWIDAKRAVIIPEGHKEIKTLNFEDSIDLDRDGRSGPSKFGAQYVSDEKSVQRREENETRRYLKEVIDEIKDSDKVVLFGPSSLKHELQDQLNSLPEHRCEIVGVVKADSMSENQLSAWVDKFYHPEKRS